MLWQGEEDILAILWAPDQPGLSLSLSLPLAPSLFLSLVLGSDSPMV